MSTEKNITDETLPVEEAEELIVDQGLIDDILPLIQENDHFSLTNILADLNHADVAQIINHLSTEDSLYIFKLLPGEIAATVLLEADDEHRQFILDSLEQSKITDIIDEMDSDDAADVIRDLDEDVAEEVLRSIDAEDSEDVKALLKYTEDSAGGLMATEFISIHEDSVIQDAVFEVKKQAEAVEDVYHLYVLDNSQKLVGTIDLKTLIITPSNKKLSEVMDQEFQSVHVSDDQELVAKIMQDHDLVSIAVLNDEQQMVGVITIDDIVDVIREEAEEDIQRLTGVNEEGYSSNPLKIVASRLPWLLVGLFGELISGLVITSAEGTLQKVIALTAYIPLVMAMGGSTGVQSTSIVIQALSRGDLWVSDLSKRLLKELTVGLINSGVCALIIFLISLSSTGSVVLGLTISLSLIFVMVNATMLGTVIPIVLKRFNIDPAIATGPFVTTLNDIIGLTIYFGIAYLIFFL